MDRQLVEDIVKLLQTTPEQIFIGARRRKTGTTSSFETDRALNDFGNFQRTGVAPQYVQDYALDYLKDAPKVRPKAHRTLKGGTESLVGSLDERDNDSA